MNDRNWTILKAGKKKFLRTIKGKGMKDKVMNEIRADVTVECIRGGENRDKMVWTLKSIKVT